MDSLYVTAEVLTLFASALGVPAVYFAYKALKRECPSRKNLFHLSLLSLVVTDLVGSFTWNLSFFGILGDSQARLFVRAIRLVAIGAVLFFSFSSDLCVSGDSGTGRKKKVRRKA